MRNAEPKLEIEGDVDAQLSSRLSLAMRLLLHWHGSPLRPVDIVAPAVKYALPDTSNTTTALFLSGGVDSLATLQGTLAGIIAVIRTRGVAFFVQPGRRKPNQRIAPTFTHWAVKHCGECVRVATLVTKVSRLRNLASHQVLHRMAIRFASVAIAHAARARILAAYCI
jgi:hypothetical protein